MPSIHALIEDHASLELYVGAIREAARSAAFDAPRAGAAIQALRIALDTHLADEAGFLYVDHMRSDPTRLEEEIVAFDLEFADLTARWGDYLDHWLIAAIAADPIGFAAETEALMGRLESRISAENRILYPLALQESRVGFKPQPSGERLCQAA